MEGVWIDVYMPFVETVGSSSSLDSVIYSMNTLH